MKLPYYFRSADQHLADLKDAIVRQHTKPEENPLDRAATEYGRSCLDALAKAPLDELGKLVDWQLVLVGATFALFVSSIDALPRLGGAGCEIYVALGCLGSSALSAAVARVLVHNNASVLAVGAVPFPLRGDENGEECEFTLSEKIEIADRALRRIITESPRHYRAKFTRSFIESIRKSDLSGAFARVIRSVWAERLSFASFVFFVLWGLMLVGEGAIKAAQRCL